MKYSKGFINIIAALLIGGLAVVAGALIDRANQKTVIPPPPQIIRQTIVQQAPAKNEDIVGSTLPSAAQAVFETYVAAQQGTSDITLTIANGTLRDGSTLSGYVCLTIDSNSPSLEYECGTASGTSITSITRGIDAVSGTSSIASLKFSHRVGADVKITDYPALTYLVRQLNGSDTIDTPIFYNSNVATSTLAANRNSIASAGLVADTAFAGAGIINATAGAKGVVQIASGLQAASTTALCSSGASCAISSANATSSYGNGSTSGLKAVITQNNGKIDNNFIDSSIFPLLNGTNVWTGKNTFSTTTATSTIIGSLPAYWIGKSVYATSSIGTSNFTVPSGINKLWIRMTGGGGGGADGGSGAQGGGGGAGGYVEAMVDVTGTTSIGITIGGGGANAGGTGGTSYFSTFLSAVGGSPGSTQTPGVGGTASGGFLNLRGGTGGGGLSVASLVGGQSFGGVNPLGNPNGCGGGGAGGAPGGSGVSGASGCAIIIW
jgi:hypothetical protein